MRSKKEVFLLLKASEISDFFNQSEISRVVGARVTSVSMNDNAHLRLNELFDKIVYTLTKKEANQK